MRFALLLLLTLILSFSKGQGVENSAIIENTKPVELIFKQVDFGENFSVLVTSDDQYDYYAIDLTKLEDRFERIYFMNLSYNESRIINLDGDINKELTWYKSYYSNKEEEINCLFKDLKEKTIQAGRTMTSEEKSQWMLENDKFKK
jgi:hypothetical protein